MNIAIFSYLEIFPIRGGAQTRIFNLARTVSDLGHSVYLVINSQEEGGQKLGNLNIVRTRFSQGFLGTPWWTSSTVSFFKNFNRIADTIDVVQCEFPFFFLSIFLTKIQHNNPPLILDEHGVESQFVKEVYFDKPGLCLKARSFLNELIAVKLSSHIFTCSKIDSEKISQIYGVPLNKITEVPNAVSGEFLEKIMPHKFDLPTVLFVGGFRHPPNYHGAKAIHDIIIPAVAQKNKKVQFVFIGEQPPSWLENGNTTKVLGYVPDVRPFISGADICISPILQGSGTRLKILEYMAMGKPVISTSKGVEGLDVSNQGNVVIEDDMRKYPDHIISLLEDKQKAERLGSNARKLIEESYTWEKVSQRAIEIYHGLQRNKK